MGQKDQMRTRGPVLARVGRTWRGDRVWWDGQLLGAVEPDEDAVWWRMVAVS